MFSLPYTWRFITHAEAVKRWAHAEVQEYANEYARSIDRINRATDREMNDAMIRQHMRKLRGNTGLNSSVIRPV